MKKLLFLSTLFVLGLFTITNLQAQTCDVQAGEPNTDVASLCGLDLANLDLSNLFGSASGGYTDTGGNFDPATTDFVSIAVDGSGNIIAISTGGVLDLSALASGETVDIYAVAYSAASLEDAADVICSIPGLNLVFDCSLTPVTDIAVFLEFIEPAYPALTLQDMLDILTNQAIDIMIGGAMAQIPIPLCADIGEGSISVTTIDVFAGALSLDPLPSPACVPSSGSYVISATPDGNASVPASFEVIYVLTDGNGDIVATSASPSFDLVALGFAGGSYTIHTLVAETTDAASPDYIDLSGLAIPSPVADFIAAADASGACYALDVAGANTGDLETCCEAEVGTLDPITYDVTQFVVTGGTAGTPTVCLPPDAQNASILSVYTAPPTDYDRLFILVYEDASGNAIIVDTNPSAASFDLATLGFGVGTYIIYALVGETSDTSSSDYIDLSVIVLGTTTISDLIASIGGVCYALEEGPSTGPLEECIPCTITVTGPCDDQGTDDSEDDTYELVIDVIGTGVASYQVSGDVTTSAAAGQTSILGPFAATMIIDITVTALDADGNEVCSDSINSLEVCECEDKIVPTVSEWGLIILALMLLNLGVLYIRQTDPKLAIVKG